MHDLKQPSENFLFLPIIYYIMRNMMIYSFLNNLFVNMNTWIGNTRWVKSHDEFRFRAVLTLMCVCILTDWFRSEWKRSALRTDYPFKPCIVKSLHSFRNLNSLRRFLLSFMDHFLSRKIHAELFLQVKSYYDTWDPRIFSLSFRCNLGAICVNYRHGITSISS